MALLAFENICWSNCQLFFDTSAVAWVIELIHGLAHAPQMMLLVVIGVCLGKVVLTMVKLVESDAHGNSTRGGSGDGVCSKHGVAVVGCAVDIAGCCSFR